MSLPVTAEQSRTRGWGCVPWQNLLGGRWEIPGVGRGTLMVIVRAHGSYRTSQILSR